jgi:hypothetical protein
LHVDFQADNDAIIRGGWAHGQGASKEEGSLG